MWYSLTEFFEWLGELRDKIIVIKDFNKAAEKAWTSGNARFRLKAKVTRGEKKYRHANSSFLGGGFNIKALSLDPLPQSELKEIGRTVVDNQELVRRLISLGYDTLEVEGFHKNGCKWALKEYANFGGFLSSNNKQDA